MNVFSLFAGIGGLELGLERAGMTVVGQVEIDPYCRRVLAKHWPEVPRHDDVRTAVEWWLRPPVADAEEPGREARGSDRVRTVAGAGQGSVARPSSARNATATAAGTAIGRPPVDLICGGFPCQPVSVAGQRLAQADPRWLWPAFHAVVRALRPRYVLVENVPGLLAAGMGDVLGDLAGIGYDAEWDRIPAAFVGAPHLRGRVFIVAYPNGTRLEGAGLRRSVTERGATVEDADGGTLDGRRRGRGTPQTGHPADVADADLLGRDRWPGIFRPGRRGQPTHSSPELADADSPPRRIAAAVFAGAGQPALLRPAQAGPGRRSGADDWWAAEPDVGRVAHGIPARLDRLRALGNAVVPQVAEHVGRLILAADQERGAA